MPGILDLVGLIFLADIDAVARRTAYTGGTSPWDPLVLCPGLHKQHDAPLLSRGEYPACAAMTTGYVFRVENEATVLFLQRVGKTGRLTTLRVEAEPASTRNQDIASWAYKALAFLTIAIVVRLTFLYDQWALVAYTLLTTIRSHNYSLIHARLSGSWHGQREPGEQGDLLVLLSQDRWMRIRGSVDDLKAVTSGKWLRDLTPWETTTVGLGTMGAYLAAMCMAGATREGQAWMLFLALVSACVVMWANARTEALSMNGLVLSKVGEPKAYARRLDLAEELIEQSGRRDWAERIGMVQPEKGGEGSVMM